MEDIIGGILEGVTELFALSESPKAFIWLIVVLAAIGGFFFIIFY